MGNFCWKFGERTLFCFRQKSRQFKVYIKINNVDNRWMNMMTCYHLIKGSTSIIWHRQVNGQWSNIIVGEGQFETIKQPSKPVIIVMYWETMRRVASATQILKYTRRFEPLSCFVSLATNHTKPRYRKGTNFPNNSSIE